MDDVLQPFVIEPKETPAIWGGDALVRTYGKTGDPTTALGESWECWDDNRVRGGAFAGKSIAQLRLELGARLMGTLDASRIFPVLTKIIDARQSLSVQVHPDDSYARRVEGQPNGKTECWVILAAQAGAELILGWSKHTTREEYERRVADGTLGEILRRVPVKENDAFYLPSGTLHAIGAGIELFETQQASDLTYRIFDWNRVGADGKPRPLHVDKAADVLDYAEATAAQTSHLRFSVGGIERETFIADPRFVVERIRVRDAHAALHPQGVPLVIMTGAHPMELHVAGVVTPLSAWTTALVAAGTPEVLIAGANPAASAFCVTPSREAWEPLPAQGGVPAAVLADFLRQFEAAPARR